MPKHVPRSGADIRLRRRLGAGAQPAPLTVRFAATVLLATGAASFVSPVLAFQVFKVDPYCPDPGVYGTIQDAVNAAAAYSDADHADYVWIATNSGTGYSGQHIVVNDPETVIIEGGFFDCTDVDPGTDLTTISGAGNDGGPVLDIIGTGHTVYLSNLFITGAQRGAGTSGGGINFSGHGELDIVQGYVFLNQAGYGAGINVSASGGQAVVKLLHDATIYLNTAAVSGGGVRLEGNSRLFVLDPKVAINGNTAAAYGGGIEILGPARADIDSPGGGFGDGVIAANYAANGGGVAVIDNGNGAAVLRVFADGSHQPVQIVENRAATNGGGIYVSAQAKACLIAPYLYNNIAEDGAAIYYEDPAAGTSGALNSAGIYINHQYGYDCGPEPEANLGGTTYCVPADAQCNVIAGSSTKHADDTPSSGSIIRAHGGDFEAVHFRLQGNIAGTGMQLDNARNMYVVRGLITDNTISGYLLLGPVENAGLAGSTIANNSIGGDHVFLLQGSQGVGLQSDIIYQPGLATIDTLGPGVLYVADLLTNTNSFLPEGNPSTVQGTPSFVDAANGDYHLRGDSLGIDFADDLTIFFPEIYLDLDGLPPVDLPQVSNFIGPVDLGAYERQFHCALDEIFCDGFNR